MTAVKVLPIYLDVTQNRTTIVEEYRMVTLNCCAVTVNHRSSFTLSFIIHNLVLFAFSLWYYLHPNGSLQRLTFLLHEPLSHDFSGSAQVNAVEI